MVSPALVVNTAHRNGNLILVLPLHHSAVHLFRVFLLVVPRCAVKALQNAYPSLQVRWKCRPLLVQLSQYFKHLTEDCTTADTHILQSRADSEGAVSKGIYCVPFGHSGHVPGTTHIKRCPDFKRLAQRELLSPGQLMACRSSF